VRGAARVERERGNVFNFLKKEREGARENESRARRPFASARILSMEICATAAAAGNEGCGKLEQRFMRLRARNE